MRIRFLFMFLLLIFSTVVHAADSQIKPAIKFIAGAAAFLDEETPLDHFVIGGAAMFGITPRLRIEPQFLYMDGPDTDRDFTLTGNVSYDLWYSDQAAFYVVGGGGLLHHTQDIGDQSFSTNEWTGSGGVGFRFYVSENFFIAPEFRIGWEPLIQVLGSAGFEF